jgi:hypothetical protein
MKRSLESPHRLGQSTETSRTAKRRHPVAARADKAGGRTAAKADWTLAPQVEKLTSEGRSAGETPTSAYETAP